MSCKPKARNFTAVEKTYFLEVLKKYASIIENKKSSVVSSQSKEGAWNAICNTFNNSSIISEKRTVQQLKKLWLNMKQHQRDTLTKERQARFATGGGPESPLAVIDPNISAIVPNLMVQAPCIATSNLTPEDMEVQRQELLHGSNAAEIPENKVELQLEISTPKTNSRNETFTVPTTKRRRVNLDEEKYLMTERVRIIMSQEEELFLMKKKHEEELHVLKKQKLQEEIRAAKASADLADKLLAKENNE